MIIHFVKYHGAGNDFIIIDNRIPILLDSHKIANLCNRRFGIGADGLICIHSGTSDYDFEIKYYNADGFEGSLCGNGSRCAVDFAYKLGICGLNTNFLAFDGIHSGEVLSQNRISVSMHNVSKIETFSDGYFLNTGSPHFVSFVSDIQNFNVFQKGKLLREDPRFLNGTNVNFVEELHDSLFVRTYERGVEDETLSCGTGVTAAAISYAFHNKLPDSEHVIRISTKGGLFDIHLTKTNHHFSNITLEGPVQNVFSGEINL